MFFKMRVVCEASPNPARETRVVVVGGGVGGMVTAGLLARRGGFNVSILEKNPDLGGRLNSETIEHSGEKYRFDTGPSLLLFPNVYQTTLKALGIDGIEMKQIKPAAYRLFYDDGGAPLDLLWDVEDMAAQFEHRERGAGKRYMEFLRFARDALELGMPNFIERDVSKMNAKSLLELVPQAVRMNPLELLGPIDLVLRRYFRSSKLRMAFLFQMLYVGLSPFNAPGVFSLLAATELTDGVWYPVGGFGKIRDEIEGAIRNDGVEVFKGIEVLGIVVDDGRVVGVRTSSGVVEADVVVSNRDLCSSYALVEGDTAMVQYAEEKDTNLGALEYSCGVVSYLFCVNKKLDGLIDHNVMINATESKRAWRPARTAAELLEWPNCYIHCASKTDVSACPEGSETVMVLLPVSNLQSMNPGDVEDLVRKGRRVVINAIVGATGDTSFEDHIVAERTIDPIEWRARCGLRHGAAFGLSHGLDQLSIFRPAAQDSAIANLFFVGASTRPGNGVPLVMIGARLVAEQIAEQYGP